MTTHEGDLANLVMKFILHKLSGDLPVFLEWSGFDRRSDTLLLTHHGVVDPRRHAADQSLCRVTPSPEKWDFTGHGFSVEYCGKEGEVTLACLLDAKDGWKLLISGGRNVQLPQTPSYAPQFHFKHEKYSVTEYIRRIVDEGVAHHVCLTYGDHREQLKLYAGYAGIPVVEI
jgi:L-arabinose isomerase